MMVVGVVGRQQGKRQLVVMTDAMLSFFGQTRHSNARTLGLPISSRYR